MVGGRAGGRCQQAAVALCTRIGRERALAPRKARQRKARQRKARRGTDARGCSPGCCYYARSLKPQLLFFLSALCILRSALPPLPAHGCTRAN